MDQTKYAELVRRTNDPRLTEQERQKARDELLAAARGASSRSSAEQRLR